MWKNKQLHGKHIYNLTQPHIDKEASNQWLKSGQLYAETEGFMIAIQDKIISTRNYKKHILKQPIPSDLCRICNEQIETIDHITSGCRILAPKQYTKRHDNVCKIIHENLAFKHSLIDTHIPYYKYTPPPVIENNNFKLYWDRSIITDRTIGHNRPDITLIDKKNKITYLIDIAIPNTNNIQSKHEEKIEKYLSLAEETRQMWHQNKTIIVPIIISATGVVPKSLHRSIKTIDLHPKLFKNLQKAVIIDTCSMVRQTLNQQ